MKNNIEDILRKNAQIGNKPRSVFELAEMLDLRRSYVQEIVDGAITPTIHLMERITKTLGIDTGEGIGSVFVIDADNRNKN